jgi:RhtB (resistance to homoserine/threonine) family protein
VDAHFLVFIGVAAVVIIVPGPDTAVILRNILLHGRRAGLGTSFGVAAGLAAWTVAAALGVASIVRASEVAFTALKLIGALYLVWLGIQAIRTAGEAIGHGEDSPAGSRRAITARAGFRQGLLSDLANPKIGIFFTSLLPQFVDPGHAVLVPFLLLGAVFVTMTTLWLIAYCMVAARLAQMLQRPRIKRALDRITGAVLIGLGLRLAAEHR